MSRLFGSTSVFSVSLSFFLSLFLDPDSRRNDCSFPRKTSKRLCQSDVIINRPEPRPAAAGEYTRSLCSASGKTVAIAVSANEVAVKNDENVYIGKPSLRVQVHRTCVLSANIALRRAYMFLVSYDARRFLRRYR